MSRRLLPLVARHEPRAPLAAHLKSGTGALVAMTAVGALASATGMPLLIAPLGATAVLLFAQPASPLAQPANVFGGYLLAALLAALVILLGPTLWWAATAAVGLAIGLMSLFRVTHPPAGAVPLVALGAPLPPLTLLAVVLVGSASLVLIALLHHRLPPRSDYPRRLG